MKKKIKRGEMYYCQFDKSCGSVQDGLRPVLIVQCNEGNIASTTTLVAPITTVIKKNKMPTHIYLNGYGLKKKSIVMLEQIRVIDQSELLDYVGYVDDKKIIKALDKALKVVFGLWRNNNLNYSKKMYLCENCFKKEKERDNIITRVDPTSDIRKKCNYCNNKGYEYLVTRSNN